VWRNIVPLCRTDATLVIRFGGIHDRKADPISVLRTSMEGSGWSIIAVRPAGSAAAGRRQALHFLGDRKAPREENDVWARLT
jgi:hypothetical protein